MRKNRDDELRRARAEYVSARVRIGVAHQVKMNRMARGWTQKELGRRAGGIMQNAISRIESGAANPTMATLVSIAHALDIAVIAQFVPFSALTGGAVPSFEDEFPPKGDEEAA